MISAAGRLPAITLLTVAVIAGAGAFAVDDAGPGVLTDLPDELRASLARLDDPPIAARSPQKALDAVFEACTPYRFDAGPLAAFTDPRWFSTAPPDAAGAPLLELRRWPGDTVVALYAIAPVVEPADGQPPVPDSTWERLPGGDPEWTEWHGDLETTGGSRPAIWIERRVVESAPRLGALVLPGDAGLGDEGVRAMAFEARTVAARVRIDPERWAKVRFLPADARVAIPVVGSPPGDGDEESEPWQVVQGSSFTMGLPPGFRARRTDGGVAPPEPLAGALLWLRGRARDTEGEEFVVGDGSHAGYVVVVDAPTDEWVHSKSPPAAAAEATRAAAEAFPLLTERTGAREATAERWEDAGMGGDWLVFRLVFPDRGYEIGLPVLKGRHSASLYWIPATWRAAGKPPAPPPVDPAERFGIRFDRLRPAARKDQPWTEGYLEAPGLRVEIPRGWFPAASLRSRDGYPVRFLDADGRLEGTLTRLSADQIPDTGSGWNASEKPGRHRATRAYRRADGSLLVVAEEGHAFAFEPGELPDDASHERWRRLVDSVQLIRTH